MLLCCYVALLFFVAIAGADIFSGAMWMPHERNQTNRKIQMNELLQKKRKEKLCDHPNCKTKKPINNNNVVVKDYEIFIELNNQIY